MWCSWVDQGPGHLEGRRNRMRIQRFATSQLNPTRCKKGMMTTTTTMVMIMMVKEDRCHVKNAKD